MEKCRRLLIEPYVNVTGECHPSLKELLSESKTFNDENALALVITKQQVLGGRMAFRRRPSSDGFCHPLKSPNAHCYRRKLHVLLLVLKFVW